MKFASACIEWITGRKSRKIRPEQKALLQRDSVSKSPTSTSRPRRAIEQKYVTRAILPNGIPVILRYRFLSIQEQEATAGSPLRAGPMELVDISLDHDRISTILASISKDATSPNYKELDKESDSSVATATTICGPLDN